MHLVADARTERCTHDFRCGPHAAPKTNACILQGKPSGLRTARKLRNTRKEQNWADKGYKRAHLGKEWAKPFAGCSHAKGIVLEKM